MACLLIMAGLHGVAADDAKLRHQFGQETFTTQTILLAAQFLGMSAKVVRQDLGRLDRAPLPAIAIDREGRYFIVVKLDMGTAVSSPAHAPRHGLPKTIRILIQRRGEAPSVLGLDGFLAQWSGEMIFFTSKGQLCGGDCPIRFHNVSSRSAEKQRSSNPRNKLDIGIFLQNRSITGVVLYRVIGNLIRNST